MVSLEQVKLLETKVTKTIDYVKKVTEENTALKGKLDSYQQRIDELEIMIKKFREEQNRIEEGILSALSRLNQFEDALESKLSFDNKISTESKPSIDNKVPAEIKLPVENKISHDNEAAHESAEIKAKLHTPHPHRHTEDKPVVETVHQQTVNSGSLIELEVVEEEDDSESDSETKPLNELDIF